MSFDFDFVPSVTKGNLRTCISFSKERGFCVGSVDV